MDVQRVDFLAIRNEGWMPSKLLTIVAGENGSGKSSLLREVARRAQNGSRQVLAITGSIHDKFKGLSLGSGLLSPRLAASSPVSVMKGAICHAELENEMSLRAISRTLRYCGYAPEVGVEIKGSLNPERPLRRIDRETVSQLAEKRRRSPDDLYAAANLALKIADDYGINWIDFDRFDFDHSLQRNITDVVFWETELIKLGVVSRVNIFVRKGGSIFNLNQASSGELSLITSLAFLAVRSGGARYILIDEPENSLHPRWQKDYLMLLSVAIGYSEAHVVIATHSPLLVISADNLDFDVEVLVFSDMFNESYESASSNIEEVLAEVFHVYTPKSNYLSRALVGLMDDVERGRIHPMQAQRLLSEIEASGVDERQERALSAVSEIIAKIGGYQ